MVMRKGVKFARTWVGRKNRGNYPECGVNGRIVLGEIAIDCHRWCGCCWVALNVDVLRG